MSETQYIYVIRDVEDGPVYVGATSRLKRRTQAHKQSGKLRDGRCLDILETTSDVDVRHAIEREWIKSFTDRGIVLLNRTTGGTGVPGLVRTPEQKAAFDKLMADPRGREIRSEHAKTQWQNEESRSKKLEGMNRPGTQQKRIESLYSNPDVRRKISESMKAACANDEIKKTRQAALTKRFTCDDCGYESNRSHLSKHQKKTGHSGKAEA